MTTLTLENMVDTLLELKAAADRPLHNVPGHLLAGAEMMKHNAAQEYEDKFGFFVGALPTLSAAIFVTGPGATKFADIATDEEFGLVIDASAIYRDIAKDWFSTTEGVGVRHFAIDSIPTFLSGVNRVVYPMGVRAISPPDFNPFFGRKVENFEDAVNTTRDILRSSCGDELAVQRITIDLAQKVLDETWANAPVVPVVITNATQGEVQGELFERLFFGRNLEFAAADNIDKNAVIIAFKHLREKLPRPAKTTPKPSKPKQSANEQSTTNPEE
jgi:hypothetical protein